MKSAVASLLLVFACLQAPAAGAVLRASSLSKANPIRKVVTLLQAMQKKVEEEGSKEKALYEKYQCYCSKSDGALRESIAAADAKVPSVGSAITASEAEKAQTQADLKQAQLDRDAAKQAIAEATALREKEAAAYAASKAQYDANTQAIAKAVEALERGMAGGFLQSGAAATLRRLADKLDMPEVDRRELAAFLAGGSGSGYAPRSQEATGILKQLGDEMAASLAEETAAEEAAAKTFRELVAAKEKEIAALAASIEAKTQRAGDLAVAVQQMKADLSDTQRALLEDRQFLADLGSSCAKKASEWQEREQTRAQELAAIAETVKILGDDEALDVFRKALPAPGASFVQVDAGLAARRARALDVLVAARRASGRDSVLVDALALALRGKKNGFEKVVAMIDGMVELLKKEQLDDEHKKEYCGTQLDASEDKQKSLERAVSDAEALVAAADDGLAKLKEEIAALTDAIKQMDKAVAGATEQRQKDHEEYVELAASDSAAKELLSAAKNRLQQFYNPALYIPPAKKELSTEDRIVANLGAAALVQVSAHRHGQGWVAPPPAPETFGAYEKQGQESTGVLAMIDLLVKDLDKELVQAAAEEKDAQAGYEVLMRDSAAKRAQDSALLTQKEATKASLEGELEAHKEAKAAAGKELSATLEYLHSLHGECDWLLRHFDVRKEARDSEAESLQRAKAVLAGADFALLQTRSATLLRGAA